MNGRYRDCGKLFEFSITPKDTTLLLMFFDLHFQRQISIVGSIFLAFGC